MNQRLKLQLAGYVDDGMDYSNSLEVRNIVDSSNVAREFYETLLFANKRLESFFQSKEIYKTNKKLHKFIDETLEPRDTFWTRWVPLPPNAPGRLARCFRTHGGRATRRFPTAKERQCSG